MTFPILFACFLLFSLIGAFLVFNFFRLRKTKSLLIVSQTGFVDTSATKVIKKKSIFKATKKLPLVTANHFLLTKEEKDFQNLNYIPIYNLGDTPQLVIFNLAEYIYKNIRVSELLTSTTYQAIPIDSDSTTIPLDRLKKLKLVTKDDFFSESGFFLLCTIAKYLDVFEFKSEQVLNNTIKV